MVVLTVCKGIWPRPFRQPESEGRGLAGMEVGVYDAG